MVSFNADTNAEDDAVDGIPETRTVLCWWVKSSLAGSDGSDRQAPAEYQFHQADFPEVRAPSEPKSALLALSRTPNSPSGKAALRSRMLRNKDKGMYGFNPSTIVAVPRGRQRGDIRNNCRNGTFRAAGRGRPVLTLHALVQCKSKPARPPSLHPVVFGRQQPAGTCTVLPRSHSGERGAQRQPGETDT